MQYSSNSYILKDGRSVIVRAPSVDDAQALVDLKRAYLHGTTTIPMTIDDYPDNSVRETELITNYGVSRNSVLLLAESETGLVGNIDLTGSARSKMHHTAMLGMGILEDWRGIGLGSILVQSALNWARDESALRVIWLDVYASNTAGVKLYRKSGFEVSGTVPAFFKDGYTYHDKVQMYLQLR